MTDAELQAARRRVFEQRARIANQLTLIEKLRSHGQSIDAAQRLLNAMTDNLAEEKREVERLGGSVADPIFRATSARRKRPD